MVLRVGIYVAFLIAVGVLPRTARSEPPPQAPLPGPHKEQPLPTPQASTMVIGPAIPRTEVRRLPAVSVESSLAASDAVADRPETLQQAWAAALAADQGLESKRRGVSSAEESMYLARAQRWPIVDLEGSYVARTAEPAFTFDLGELPIPTNVFRYAQSENAAFRAKMEVPLYTSGHIRHAIDAAAAEVASATLEVEKSTSDLKMQVAEEYVTVLRAQRDVEVTESTVASLEAHARDVEMLFNHNQVSRNDLLAAQVALSNARQRAIQVHNRLDASRAAYNRRLGRPLTSTVRIAELPVQTMEEDVEILTARALGRRPAIARIAAQARALQHQANSLLGKSRPQVKLWGGYTFEENRFRTPEGIASVGVGVNWNVFDGGRERHGAAALLQRAEGLLRTRADLESMIALDVRRAWLDVQETRRRLKVTPEACRRADENLRVARKRYALGMAINTEVLDAQTLRTETYRNHDNATYDAVLAVLRLRHATGGLK